MTPHKFLQPSAHSFERFCLLSFHLIVHEFRFLYHQYPRYPIFFASSPSISLYMSFAFFIISILDTRYFLPPLLPSHCTWVSLSLSSVSSIPDIFCLLSFHLIVHEFRFLYHQYPRYPIFFASSPSISLYMSFAFFIISILDTRYFLPLLPSHCTWVSLSLSSVSSIPDIFCLLSFHLIVHEFRFLYHQYPRYPIFFDRLSLIHSINFSSISVASGFWPQWDVVDHEG